MNLFPGEQFISLISCYKYPDIIYLAKDLSPFPDSYYAN